MCLSHHSIGLCVTAEKQLRMLRMTYSYEHSDFMSIHFCYFIILQLCYYCKHCNSVILFTITAHLLFQLFKHYKCSFMETLHICYYYNFFPVMINIQSDFFSFTHAQ